LWSRSSFKEAVVITARRKLLAILAFGLLAALATAGTANADVVHCGEVLTQSTVVENDLSCPQEGLYAGRDGIVIDLNGHSITQVGQGDP
jgi:hypothetical protein